MVQTETGWEQKERSIEIDAALIKKAAPGG